jgi:hypothetical protein
MIVTGSVVNLLMTFCGSHFFVIVTILRVIRHFIGVLKAIEAIEAIVEYYQPFFSMKIFT